MNGLGCACSEVIPFVVLMRHFQRYRGTVISAMYIITAVSGFLMPVLYEYVRQEWGFRICLLVMGSLNVGMLCGCIVVSRMPLVAPVDGSSQSPSSNTLATSSAPKLLSDVSLSTDSYLVGSILINKSQQNSRTGSFVDVDSLREKTPLVQQQQRMRRGLLRPFNHHASCSFATIPSSKPGVMSFTFLHITISRAATIFALAVFLLILLDYSADRHLEPVQGVFLLTVFTIGDLLSRILSGSLVDLQIVSPSLLMSATFLIQGLAYFMLVYVDLYGALLIASFLVGLTGGCRNILATVMVTEECEDASLALSLGLMNFVTGVAIVVQPALIGYVRDTLGTYEPLLLGFGIVNCSLSSTWLLTVVCNCRRKRLSEFV
ncbi:uncharacterized protein LOC111261145 isoform X2 [Varroa jacobsoni]|uniref:uncharacterized protein LOC111261145 isoform X2 n=1 Tax=Varroa jacobsoni TaxID=62625 RepID=UPI000BF5ACA1|nr:uncharacterized protein LOC111261145 isoform X2 [Varroa jacobsoni]